MTRGENYVPLVLSCGAQLAEQWLLREFDREDRIVGSWIPSGKARQPSAIPNE